MTEQAPKLTPKGQRTRAAILESGKTIFSKSGYVAARMSDIAATAGMSLGAVYRYFADKDAIFSELFEDLHSRFLAATRTHLPLDNLDDVRESVRSATKHYFDVYSLEREFMGAVVEASATNDRYMSRWAAMHEEITSRFTRRIEAFMPTPRASDRIRETVFALVCMSEQVAYVSLSRRGDRPSIAQEDLAETVSSIWWASLAAGLIEPSRGRAPARAASALRRK